MNTKTNYHQKLLFSIILIYALYVVTKITYTNTLLADDLSKMYESIYLDSNFIDFIFSFLDSATMSARPVSGLLTGSLIYISSYNQSLYFLGLLLFPISIITLYNVSKHFINKELALLAVILYTSSIFASSIQFSPIMLNSNLALIFWLVSVYFLRKTYNPFLSGLFYILSILSYEIFFPLLIINALLIKSKRGKFLYFISILSVLIFYKKIAQPLLFINSYQRDNLNQLLNIGHLKKVILFTGKMFLRDYIFSLIKGIKNIIHFNLIEIVFPVIIGLTTYFHLKKEQFIKFNFSLNKALLISFSLMMLCLSIFIFSTYIPTLYGFDNRNLGGVRLFSSFFILMLILYVTKRLNIKIEYFRIIFSAIVALVFVVNLSSMNAWIYASDFNKKMFKDLAKNILNNNNISTKICIDYDVYNFQKNNKYLILREPTFFNNWEAPYLLHINGLNPKKMNVIIKERRKDNFNCQSEFKYEQK
ncbi:hypothetical protein M949_0462 [Riemerella anatipestifer CH3]|uniref:hypothetical protein n=1 Tax=Riemerella anatipestifer TaxID=34085 RepID=UPI0004DC3A38|nr:hypothetical protein [Riemerella anatipestifer]AIH01633.1 hypothetical protein M949_0462 [Riemerella anatipestifer CH3]